ncbi:pyocin knob domain-containing protein [Paenibacillus sp. FSL R5-0749]|uniref:pyocin knob domain-containing protein n=1 Tax=Paenibacillus sp. FSL R5-0749 TaxID=2921657 RepID=UPI00315A46C4
MLETMYPAAVNSRQTELAQAIDDTQTSFTVLDGSVLPPAPNLLTLGTDESAETVLYTGLSENEVTGVTRGFESTAKTWAAGIKLARYFTAYDHDTFRDNIADLDERLNNIPAPQDASLTDKGIVQLSNAIDGARENIAPTEKAVNDARLSAISASKLYVDELSWQKRPLTEANGGAIQLPSGSDLNSLVDTGFYYVPAAVNGPSSSTFFVEIITQKNAAGVPVFLMQRAIRAGLPTQTFYQRNYNNGTWYPWSVDLFTSVSDGKNAIAAAITGKGVAASGSDTFPQLATKIGQIQTSSYYRQTLNFGINWAPKLGDANLSDFLIANIPAGATGIDFYTSNYQGSYSSKVNSMYKLSFGILDSNGEYLTLFEPSIGYDYYRSWRVDFVNKQIVYHWDTTSTNSQNGPYGSTKNLDTTRRMSFVARGSRSGTTADSSMPIYFRGILTSG